MVKIATLLLLLGVPAVSQSITAVSYGTAFYYASNYPTHYINGDRFTTTWGAGGIIYTTHDDTGGWNDAQGGGCITGRNLEFSSISGYTSSAIGTLINSMDVFGDCAQKGSDSAAFKTYGLMSVSGTLYQFVARDTYNSSSPPYVETVANSQLIKSTNSGVTWTPLPPSTAQPYASPMFSGTTFPTPMFIQYGQDGACSGEDNCSTYIYAISNEGCWNNCSKMFLGRVARANIASLSASDWSFYQGGDGTNPANWGAAGTAASIISESNHVGMAGAQYVPACSCYALWNWYYPGPPASLDTTDTFVELWQSPTPWGTWTKVQTDEFHGSTLGYYSITSVPSSVSSNTLTLALSGNFFNSGYPGTPYTLILLPVTLTISGGGGGAAGSQVTPGTEITAGVKIQ